MEFRCFKFLWTGVGQPFKMASSCLHPPLFSVSFVLDLRCSYCGSLLFLILMSIVLPSYGEPMFLIKNFSSWGLFGASCSLFGDYFLMLNYNIYLYCFYMYIYVYILQYCVLLTLVFVCPILEPGMQGGYFAIVTGLVLHRRNQFWCPSLPRSPHLALG